MDIDGEQHQSDHSYLKSHSLWPYGFWQGPTGVLGSKALKFFEKINAGSYKNDLFFTPHVRNLLLGSFTIKTDTILRTVDKQ